MAAPDSFASGLYAEPLTTSQKESRTISRGLFRRITTLIEVCTDFLTCAFSISAACFIYRPLHDGSHIQHPVQDLAVVSIVFGFFAVLLSQRDGIYRGDGGVPQIRETERAIRIPTQALLLLLPFCFLLKLNISRTSFVIAPFLTPLLLLLQKQILLSAIRVLHTRNCGIDRVIVFGARDTGLHLVTTLIHSPRLGLRPVAVIDDDPAMAGQCMCEIERRRRCSVPVQYGSITPALLKSYRCSLLIVAIPNISPEKLMVVTRAAEQAGLRIVVIPTPAVEERQRTGPADADELLLTSLIGPLVPRQDAIAKRVADVVVSSLLLVLLAPLFLLIALLIWLDSPGPALFVQKRVGRNGERFDIYKFRSMHMNVPRYDFSPRQSSDPRITRVGRFLRRNSLDELPQLLNVVLGDMSLVGPRPEMPFIVETYNSRQKQRLQVTPGITGLWQLSADRAYSIHENVHYDLYYIRNRTFFMDIAILIHTLFFAMRGGV